MKILGWWSNEANDMSTHLMRTKSVVHHQAFMLKPALRYLNLQQRKIVVQAKILSKLKYGLCLYAGQKETIKGGVDVLVMFCYRLIYRENTYMMRNERICEKIGLEMPNQIIQKSALLFIQKVMFQNVNKDILGLFKSARFSRSEKQINLNYIPRTLKFRRSCINYATKIYNTVDPKLRCVDPRKFKVILSKRQFNFDPG